MLYDDDNGIVWYASDESNYGAVMYPSWYIQVTIVCEKTQFTLYLPVQNTKNGSITKYLARHLQMYFPWWIYWIFH